MGRRAIVSLNKRQMELLEALDPVYGESIHLKARRLVEERLIQILEAPGVMFRSINKR